MCNRMRTNQCVIVGIKQKAKNLTTISVGWVQRSETQHQLLYWLGFVTSTQPTHDDVFIMGNQLDMI